MIFLHLLTVQNGGIKRSSLEVLSRGRELVDSISQSNEQSAGSQAELHAVVCSPEVASWDEAKWAAELGAYGVDTVWSATDEAFKEHNNQALLSAVQSAHAQATDQGAKPSVVAMASTEGVKDILGALSMRLGASVVADVSEFGVVAEGDGVLLTATRPVMASKANTHVRAQAQHVMVSVRSGSYGILENGENQNAKPLNHQPVRIVPLKIERADSKLQTQIREIITAAADTIDLNEAEAIVAAGRGVKDEAAKALIAELAGVLNAGIGASRALTEAGIYDPSVQIGQTGKVVSPQLYIAVGISGAIQHVAGITNSKVIVAVNKDADAPIFEVADYGIVGDLYEVLPALIAEIKRVKG
jgi:electron transfer flavoprotein alpha subunit